MRVLWITAIAIVIDQIAKWAVVKYMYLGQSIPLVGDWFRMTFTTNPGMAFGINFGPPGLVTVLSILATGLIIAYMYTVRRGYAPYLASLALILGGALGNIIDRMFYGVIYEGRSLFTGEVVDFIHFNIWKGYIPEGIPVFGGSYLALFPIWNVADMAIVCGVVGILLFQNRFHERRLAAEQAEGALVATNGSMPVATDGSRQRSESYATPSESSEEPAIVYGTPRASDDETVIDGRNLRDSR